MVSPNKVTGADNGRHDIMVFALSTCVWCKKAKRLLNDLDVSYEFIDVDELSGKDKSEVIEELEKHNPRCTFPTIVIDGECIVGYKENLIKEALT